LESTEEAREFLEKLSLILDYLDVYDPTEEGAFRVDANISIEGGNRVEIKNITGFKNVEKALNYEVVRQKSAQLMGMSIVRETRHFDAGSGVTSTLRLKEEEEDYGYITEPDLVKINLKEEWIHRLKDIMPELPYQRTKRLVDEYGIPWFQSDIIVRTGLHMSNFFEKSCALHGDYEAVSNWLVTFVMKSLNFERMSLTESKLSPETFVELLELIEEGTISERLAKELVKEYVKTGESPKKLVKEKNLELLDESQLKLVVSGVISEFPKAVDDFNSGKTKAAEYLIGQVLRRIRARAAVNDVRRLVLEELKKN
jgi:aspartyl-tRNA(Asn)/glutamyl-tRNA(Gln) amidotransferase subunit B